MKNKLPVTEELDFHYLLSLMPAMHDVPGFAWLPELFSIIGYDDLVVLCKYAGGEYIQIPTVEQLSNSVQALQAYYDIDIKKTKTADEITDKEVKGLYYQIKRTSKDAGNGETED